MPREPRTGPGKPARGSAGLSYRAFRCTTLTGRRPADLLIIGGGITGAGIARDAAMRGSERCWSNPGSRLGDQLTIEPADPRRPPLPRARPIAAGPRGPARAPDPPHHRTPPGPAAALHLPGPPGRPRAAVEALAAGMLALRHPRPLPECAATSDTRQARPAPAGADAARARAGRRCPVLGRAVRRCPPRHRHGPVGHAAWRRRGHLHLGDRPRADGGEVRGAVIEDETCARARFAPPSWSTRRAPGPTAPPARGPGATPSCAAPAGLACDGPPRADRAHRRHHPDQPHRRPGDVRAPVGRLLLHRHHRHRRARPAGGGRAKRGRCALPAPLGQRLFPPGAPDAGRRASRAGPGSGPSSTPASPARPPRSAASTSFAGGRRACSPSPAAS